MDHAFGIIPKNSLLKPRSPNIFSRNFVISLLISRSKQYPLLVNILVRVLG